MWPLLAEHERRHETNQPPAMLKTKGVDLCGSNESQTLIPCVIVWHKAVCNVVLLCSKPVFLTPATQFCRFSSFFFMNYCYIFPLRFGIDLILFSAEPPVAFPFPLIDRHQHGSRCTLTPLYFIDFKGRSLYPWMRFSFERCRELGIPKVAQAWTVS